MGPQLLGDDDGAVLAARTTHGDGHGRLALPENLVARNRRTRRGAGGRPRPRRFQDELADARRLARPVPEPVDIERVRQEPGVKDNVRIPGQAALVAEARQDDLGLRLLPPQDALGDDVLELVDVELEASTTSSASWRIGCSLFRSSRTPSRMGLRGASGCGRRVSLKRLARASSVASRKTSLTGTFFGCPGRPPGNRTGNAARGCR